MIILNYITKGFIRIDDTREFSISAITKEVRFRQEDGQERYLPEEEYIDLIRTGANVSCPYEYGDLVVTTNSIRYIFENIMLSIDVSVFLVDEILSCLNSQTENEVITIHLDCPNEDSGDFFKMEGNLIAERLI